MEEISCVTGEFFVSQISALLHEINSIISYLYILQGQYTLQQEEHGD